VGNAAPSGDAVLDAPKRRKRHLTALRAAVLPVLIFAEVTTVRTGEWAAIAQQVLDATTGSHVALLPLADETGEIDDFVIVAASPEVVDLSGRTGRDMVGLRVRQAYPTVVGDAAWRAWREVAAGAPAREVGPVGYVGEGPLAGEQMTLIVRVAPVGTGVLSSWIRHDEQSRLAERVAQAERLGNLGWAEADLPTGASTWSDGLYRIYERDPALGPLSFDEQRALTVAEDMPVHRAAEERLARGEPVDITYRIRVAGRIKHIRAVLDAVRDVHGTPIRAYGLVQDVTAGETSLARLADAQLQLHEQRRSLAAEHRLAMQLQQIVLPIPDQPIDLPGIRVAVRYLPAERASRVGGDWYHAATALDGSVVIAVGDVAGHGIRAATVMAQVRYLLAGLIITATSDPSRLLAHLNQLLLSLDTTATALVGRFEPDTRALTWAQAGHHAPLRTRAGITTQLERPAGNLLGAFPDARYPTATLTLDEGDLLLLYTDGLIERRGHPFTDALAPVIDTLNRISATGSRQPLADLLAQLPPANPEDDTCLIAARLHPPRGYRAAAASPGR
jgi:serine phosphatase RsbU (regulator of sigma subunit)